MRRIPWKDMLLVGLLLLAVIWVFNFMALPGRYVRSVESMERAQWRQVYWLQRQALSLEVVSCDCE